MKLSKANLLTVKVASQSKNDPALNQVRVEEDGTTVAADGQVVMVVEPAEYGDRGIPPGLPDFKNEIDIPEGGLGIPVDIVEETLRNIPKGKLGLELGYAVLTGLDQDKRSLEITTTDLNMHRKTEGKLARRHVPEYKSFLRLARRSVDKGGGRVCVDRKALIKLVAAIDSACPDSLNTVFLEFGEQSSDGLLVRAKSAETGQHVIGYLNPLDTGDQWLSMNEWERKTCAQLKGKKKKKKIKDKKERL